MRSRRTIASRNQSVAPQPGPVVSRWQMETKAGDYWMVKEGEQYFPVIICDDECVEEFFQIKDRPVSARQADGNWNPEYKLEHALAKERVFPVLYLGTSQYAWIPCHLLETFDINLAHPILECVAELSVSPILKKAWEAALDWEEDLSFWKAKLYTMRYEKLKEQSPSNAYIGSVLQLRKRSEPTEQHYALRSTARAKRPFKDENEDNDASPVPKMEVKEEPRYSTINIKQEPRTLGSFKQEIEPSKAHPGQKPQRASSQRSDDLDDAPPIFRSFRCNKRHKTNQSDRFKSQSNMTARADRDAGHSATIHKTPGIHSDDSLGGRIEPNRSATQSLYNHASLLNCVDDFFTNGTHAIRDWLVDFISTHFFELMEADGVLFADKLKRNPGLSNAVFKKMHELTMR